MEKLRIKIGKKKTVSAMVDEFTTGGTTDHNLLKNRDMVGQHPINAIDGLEDALNNRVTNEKLTAEVDSALKSAKDSGLFNGKDGKDGHIPQKGIDYFDGERGNDGVGILSIEQEFASSTDGGENIIKITLTDGRVQRFIIKNGSGGEVEISQMDVINALGYTPINRDSIVNNLETSVVNKPLSAAQGVELSKRILEKLDKGSVVNDLETNAPGKPLSASMGHHLKWLIDNIIIPTKVSELENDKGYLTEHQDLSGYAKKTEVTEHNTSDAAHSDIRLLIAELSNRINAVLDSDDVDLDQLSELVAYIKSNRNLIEQVTTNKVNVKDIIDNLSTNVANKPLSAAQGAELKALIDELTEKKVNVTDIVNDLVTDNAMMPLSASMGKALKDLITQVNNYIHGVQAQIPAKTSQLINDSGFLTEYQALTDYAQKHELPTMLSQLENNCGFLSESEIIAKINEKISAQTHWRFSAVSELPETGEENIIYLVSNSSKAGNLYEEYLWIANNWELVGSTHMDLMNYYDINYIDQLQRDLRAEIQAEKPKLISQLTNDSGFVTKDHTHSVADLTEQPFETVETRIEWDGDTTGREVFTINGTKYYKVSDIVIPFSEAKGKIVVDDSGWDLEIGKTNNYFDRTTYWFTISVNMACVINSSSASPGIYFGTGTSYMKWETEKLKAEHLPDSCATKEQLSEEISDWENIELVNETDAEFAFSEEDGCCTAIFEVDSNVLLEKYKEGCFVNVEWDGEEHRFSTTPPLVGNAFVNNIYELPLGTTFFSTGVDDGVPFLIFIAEGGLMLLDIFNTSTTTHSVKVSIDIPKDDSQLPFRLFVKNSGDVATLHKASINEEICGAMEFLDAYFNSRKVIITKDTQEICSIASVNITDMYSKGVLVGMNCLKGTTMGTDIAYTAPVEIPTS